MDVQSWTFNSTFWASGGGGPAPPHKHVTLLYQVGYGCLEVREAAATLTNLNETSDAVVFNIGAHCMRAMGLERWRAYIDELAGLLTSLRGTVVWRTTPPVREHVFRRPDGSRFILDAHFAVRWWRGRGRGRRNLACIVAVAAGKCCSGRHRSTRPPARRRHHDGPTRCSLRLCPRPQTDMRRTAFDSYAEHAMRSAGVPVWDVTAFGMGGGYRGEDMAHFDGQTVRTLNLEMAEAVWC